MRITQIKFPAKHPYDFFIIGSIICLGLFLWMGNKPSQVVKPSNINVYGGDLSNRIRNTLQCMNEAINDAHTIVKARPDQVLFITENREVNQYTYAYNTLYYNDNPVISNVRAFHFEYRDDRGNLLVRAEKYLSTVETIGYTVRLMADRREVMINSRVKLPLNRSTPNSANSQIAWVSTLD